MFRKFPSTLHLYSLFFSALVLAVLASFAWIPNLTLSTLEKDYRGRKNLASIYSNLRVRLGDRVFNNAVVGDNGWIFYTGETSIPDYQNTIPFSEERLQSLQTALDALNASAASEFAQV